MTTTTTTTKIKSISDMAYQQARAGDTVANMAYYAITHITGFPESVSKEARAELYKGYRIRYNELCTPILASTEEGETSLSVEYAYSYSQQAFGGLKAEKPILHAELKVIREKTSTYCSNRLADLVFQAKRIKGSDKKKARPEAITFGERVPKVLEDLESKVKVAMARDDSTADLARFRAAKQAFLKVWNEK